MSGRKLLNLSGQRFGYLVVVTNVGTLDKKRGYWWKCKCDCGSFTLSNASDLRSGHKKSCGCKNYRLPKGEAAFNIHYGSYVRTAKKKRRAFELTREQFRKLVLQPCYYCNTPPERKIQKRNCWGEFKANGIDRVNNDKGYTLDNVVSCCPECNYMKMSLSLEGFLNRIHIIEENMKLKKQSTPLRLVAG